MNQVRVITPLAGADFAWLKGRTLIVGSDISEDGAKRGIAAGHLAEVQAPKKIAHEQTTVQAKETAAIPGGRPRR